MVFFAALSHNSQHLLDIVILRNTFPSSAGKLFSLGTIECEKSSFSYTNESLYHSVSYALGIRRVPLVKLVSNVLMQS